MGQLAWNAFYASPHGYVPKNCDIRQILRQKQQENVYGILLLC